jgi:hypothetical protein
MNTASIESKSTTLGCTAANGEYVGIGECARLTGLSQQTVRRMNGELPHYVTGGGTRKYRLSDIKTYVDPIGRTTKRKMESRVFGVRPCFLFSERFAIQVYEDLFPVVSSLPCPGRHGG